MNNIKFLDANKVLSLHARSYTFTCPLSDLGGSMKSIKQTQKIPPVQR